MHNNLFNMSKIKSLQKIDAKDSSNLTWQQAVTNNTNGVIKLSQSENNFAMIDDSHTVAKASAIPPSFSYSVPKPFASRATTAKGSTLNKNFY